MGKLPIIQKENFLLEPNRVLLFLFVVHFTPPYLFVNFPLKRKSYFYKDFINFYKQLSNIIDCHIIKKRDPTRI